MRTRAISSIVLIIPIALLLWAGGLPWLCGIVLVAGAGVYELTAALRHANHHPFPAIGYFLAIALPCAAYADPSLTLLLPVIALAVAASLVMAMLRPSLEGALVDWALSLAGDALCDAPALLLRGVACASGPALDADGAPLHVGLR